MRGAAEGAGANANIAGEEMDCGRVATGTLLTFFGGRLDGFVAFELQGVVVLFAEAGAGANATAVGAVVVVETGLGSALAVRILLGTVILAADGWKICGPSDPFATN
jgi:hypothetical protein